MTNTTRRQMLVGTGLFLAAFGVGAGCGSAFAQESHTVGDTPKMRLAPPPVPLGTSRIPQVEWFVERRISPGRIIFTTYSDIYGIPAETAVRMFSGLSGGVGHTGGTCGMITAAVMLISLKHASSDIEDRTTHSRMVTLGKQFTEDFKTHYGATACRDIIKMDISTPELYALSKEKAGTYDGCYAGTAVIAKILETKYDILNSKSPLPATS